MTYIIERTCAGDCGSFTVYAVNWEKELAAEIVRVPWNDALNQNTSKVFCSENAALLHLSDDIEAEWGTIPPHFKIVKDAAGIVTGKEIQMFEELEKLQSDLSRNLIQVDTPCGNEPFVEILGGISARAQINLSKPGRFPTVAQEYKLAKELISLLLK